MTANPLRFSSSTPPPYLDQNKGGFYLFINNNLIRALIYGQLSSIVFSLITFNSDKNFLIK